MFRKIIKIDRDRCNGCGACVTACHEGAIEMLDGKAHLAREDYCDGLGDCLPACPTGAISFEEREALSYNEAAVASAKRPKSCPAGGCPGAAAKKIGREERVLVRDCSAASELAQWPCQIKLVPINAPYFEDADLLVAADCSAFAYGAFHRDFIRGHITLIGCPKLDAVDYAEKLTAILQSNRIKSVTVVRMEVPCCGGIENAVLRAVNAVDRQIPLRVVTVSTDGKILK